MRRSVTVANDLESAFGGRLVERDTRGMDEHARRVAQTFVDAVEGFRGGRISLLQLSATASRAAASIDNANAPLRGLLEGAAGDLEYAHFTIQSEEQASEAERILRPVLAAIADDI